jgi:twinkle protein
MADDSTFLFKEPCPKCGSRDNLARYSDGHAHCFGCAYYEPGDGTEPQHRRTKMASDLIQGGECVALGKRQITEETTRKFGYKLADFNGQLAQVAPYFNAEGSIVGQKVRFANKDFRFLGSSDCLLFGQQLWGQGGRMVVVTEGEIDAMSVSQLQGNKWPVVSVPNGAQGAKKALARQLEWLSSYEAVVLMFDMDEPGRAAAQECAELFPPGRCKIASLPLKDPNECLQAGRGPEVINAIWNAKVYRPDGIVTLADIRENVMKDPQQGLSWFSDELTALTYGRRTGEIYAFGAGTGIGKTDWLTQQMQHDISVLNEPIAVFALEQHPTETAKRLAGKLAGKTFHIPDGSWTREDLSAALDSLEGSGKVFLYDSFGATEWERIQSTIRYLARAEGVRLFYLDHLTALAAAEDDERKALEAIMAEMGGLVKELDITIHLVSHLATPEGKPHEEGGRVMIRHFKGSRAIGFWCHYMFGLERNQQDDNEEARVVTAFRILKDRYTGRATGQTIHFGYDPASGKVFETTAPEASGFKDETQQDF